MSYVSFFFIIFVPGDLQVLAGYELLQGQGLGSFQPCPSASVPSDLPPGRDDPPLRLGDRPGPDREPDRRPCHTPEETSPRQHPGLRLQPVVRLHPPVVRRAAALSLCVAGSELDHGLGRLLPAANDASKSNNEKRHHPYSAAVSFFQRLLRNNSRMKLDIL